MEAISMKKSNNSLLIVIFLLCIFLLQGCSVNQFNNDYEQFKKLYMSATDFVDRDEDVLKALSAIDDKQINKDFTEIKKLYYHIGNELDTEKEKRIYGNLSMYYKNVEFILSIYNKDFDTLTVDEKRELGLNIMYMKSFRNDILSGDV